MKLNKNIMWALALAICLPSTANATNKEVNNSVQQSSGFSGGSIAPFTTFDVESPNYGEATTFDSYPTMKLYWQQSGYNGQRADRGIEFGASNLTYKEGWCGFEFYLPSPGYPKNKTAAICQLFQNGSCNSWCSLINVINGALNLQYRGYCGTPVNVTITGSIQYNAWKQFVIHSIASHESAGTIEVWYDGSVAYTATGINFGFGTWNGDTLASGNGIAWAFGQYNYDDGNYTSGETRTCYETNCCTLVGNPSGAYNTANPSGS